MWAFSFYSWYECSPVAPGNVGILECMLEVKTRDANFFGPLESLNFRSILCSGSGKSFVYWCRIVEFVAISSKDVKFNFFYYKTKQHIEYYGKESNRLYVRWLPYYWMEI